MGPECGGISSVACFTMAAPGRRSSWGDVVREHRCFHTTFRARGKPRPTTRITRPPSRIIDSKILRRRRGRQGSRARLSLFKPILSTDMTFQLLGIFPRARFLFVLRHLDDVVRSSLTKFGTENRLGHVRSWMEDGFSEIASAPPPEATR